MKSGNARNWKTKILNSSRQRKLFTGKILPFRAILKNNTEKLLQHVPPNLKKKKSNGLQKERISIFSFFHFTKNIEKCCWCILRDFRGIEQLQLHALTLLWSHTHSSTELHQTSLVSLFVKSHFHWWVRFSHLLYDLFWNFPSKATSTSGIHSSKVPKLRSHVVDGTTKTKFLNDIVRA